MKRTEIVALSRAATKRVLANKMGVVKPTKLQLAKLAEHKKKKAERKAQERHYRAAAG